MLDNVSIKLDINKIRGNISLLNCHLPMCTLLTVSMNDVAHCNCLREKERMPIPGGQMDKTRNR